jgi:glycosyltransferase involved in cell wall biosynthesis
MKILILAPHPFYQERGTPIAVDLLIKALLERGDKVDLLTFHEGINRNYEGLSIYRIQPFTKLKDIKPGFSLKKLICDIYLFCKFVSLMYKKQYDIVHAVEESAFLAMLVCPFKRIPFIYDMDSSMTTQLVDKFAFLLPFRIVLHFFESMPMRYAEAVLPMCDALENDAKKSGAKRIVVLKDVSLIRNRSSKNSILKLRNELGIKGKIVIYIGNLEPYQGIDLMLKSFAIAGHSNHQIDMVIIGGENSDIKKYQHLSTSLGVIKNVHFLGKKPVAHIGEYMAQADLLLSPRIHGVNTPMKIYSYLHSGVAVLATDMPTHTQVMNKEIAILAEPESNSFAKAMLDILYDEEKRQKIGRQARDYIESEHSYSAFKKTLYDLYDSLDAKRPL